MFFRRFVSVFFHSHSSLLKNKPELVQKAREVFNILKKKHGAVMWDDNGNIGKRYRRQDEIGTPYCVVIDFDASGFFCVTGTGFGLDAITLVKAVEPHGDGKFFAFRHGGKDDQGERQAQHQDQGKESFHGSTSLP